ncbi:MAG: TrkA family potassium uptake protein [Actinomycetota bacterium]|nr:TrkA family potassium uptake protein [Actinomycetota bacterium]MDD5666488.1 TrkA family potassium uptake protein [Actinomycetota bacterium]
MHVVIGGCGRVGSYLAYMLEREGHSVAVIDKDPESFENLWEGFSGRKVRGVVFDHDALIEAGIDRADAFASVTSGDNSNIVSARLAKEHFRVPRVITRIYDPRRAEIYRRLNIPTIASVAWAGHRMLSYLSHGELDSQYQFGNGEVDLVRLELPSQLTGRSAADLNVPMEVQVVCIVRGASAQMATQGTVFKGGDILYIAVARESQGKLERLLGLK